jgi:hypothetical protein
MLFGFAGRKGHGKDACADIMVSAASTEVAKVAFADPIKLACSALFVFSPAQLHNARAKETIDPRWGITPRQAMQFVGTDLIQQHMDELLPGVGRTFFVKAMRHRIQEMWSLNPDLLIVVSDVRFQHEVDLIHELGGWVFRVTRPNAAPSLDTHASEVMVDSLVGIDEEVINHGTLDDLETNLKEAGERLAERVLREEC